MPEVGLTFVDAGSHALLIETDDWLPWLLDAVAATVHFLHFVFAVLCDCIPPISRRPGGDGTSSLKARPTANFDASTRP
jgi:hypothetical protein